MPTIQEVPGIVDQVRHRLANEAQHGVPLRVSGDRLDDDWLYIVVTQVGPAFGPPTTLNS